MHTKNGQQIEDFLFMEWTAMSKSIYVGRIFLESVGQVMWILRFFLKS